MPNFNNNKIYVFGQDIKVYYAPEFKDSFDFLKSLFKSVFCIDALNSSEKVDITIAKADISAEEYSLEINNNGVLISASDIKGANYAISTLIQMINRDGSLSVPYSTISDAPYTQIRGVHFYMPKRADIEQFKRIIDTMAFLKMNTVILEVGAGMQYDKHPEINETWVKFCETINKFPGLDGYKSFQGSDFYWKDSLHTELAGGSYLTKDEVRDIVKYCKSRGMNVIPEVQGLSHSYYLTIAHPEIAELKDDPFPDTYCPNNEKSYELYFDVAGEVLEVFEPTTVSIGHDEIRVLGWCDKCKDKTGHELVGKEILRLHDFYKKHNVKIAMWAESAQTFISYKGNSIGDKPVERYDKYGRYYKLPATNESIDMLPNDILMLDWYHSLGPKSEECFDKRDFEVIYGNFHGSQFGEWDKRSSLKCVKGAEVSSWCPANEEIFARDGLFFEMMFSANILWNEGYNNSEYQNVCRSIESIVPFVRAINKYTPSEIRGKDAAEIIYLGNKEGAYGSVSFDKTSITDPDLNRILSPLGTVYGTPIDTGNILIKKDFKANSILFIHNTKCEMKFYPSHYFKDEKIWGVGIYAVCYDDGTVETVDLYYGRQVGCSSLTYGRHRDGEEKGIEIDIDIEEGAKPTLPCYYTMNNEWVESLVYNTTPIIGDSQTVFTYEWKNPFPEKTITKIRPYHIKTSTVVNNVEQAVVLYAVLAV